MKTKRLISLVLAVLMCTGMLAGIVPASAANPVYIIDPAGTDGAAGTLNGVSGTVYTTYAAFESAFTAGGTADVYFAAGEFGDVTVTKSVNLYGAKKGIDPNVKGSDILQPWTLNPNRGSGETVVTGKFNIKTTGTNGVLVDGFTVDKAGYFQVDSSAQKLTVTIQNIVVGENCSRSDFFLNASPKVNIVPSRGNYYMNFNLKNVYAGNYKGAGHFIYFISALNTTLDNIYYSNTTTPFLQTSAASAAGLDNFVMKNSFIYNNIPAVEYSIWHRFPSGSMKESVTYTDNVFYNAHGTTNDPTPEDNHNSHTILCGELKNLTQYYNFTGNTFVTDYGAKAAVRVNNGSVATGANGYDVSNMVIKYNRFVGYASCTNNYSATSITFNGKLDLSDNFTVRAAAQNKTANKVADYSTVAKCKALTGVAPKGIDQGIIAKVDGSYYKDFDMIVSSADGAVAIIDPNGQAGSFGTVNGVRGKIYNSYADFEADYAGDTANVYFPAGEIGNITVTKSVNLYGAKKGIDPNVKGSDILQPWTLNANRGSGESVLTGLLSIKSTGDVTVDGFTVDKAGQIRVDCSTQDIDVTVQNIVVGKNGTRTDHLLMASPDIASNNTVPPRGNYKLDFTFKNVYADGYKGTGHFIHWLAVGSATLDNIYYANTTTHFMETTAANNYGDKYVMKNSFFYNVLTTMHDSAVYHRFPSDLPASVTYTDNVFYNAHRANAKDVNSQTVFFDELKSLRQCYTFTGNTFVTDYGAKAAVRVVGRGYGTANGYDASNMVFKENRFIGFANCVSNHDSNYGKSGYTTKYNGVLDLSDNFNVRPAAQSTTTAKVADYSTVAKCKALTGGTPQGIDKGIITKVDGPYYLDFDKTISTDMLRVTDVDMSNVSINGTTIKGIAPENYLPKFTFTCGNDIARTMVIKNSAGTVVDAITQSGSYTVTLGYETQSRDYTLNVQTAVAFDGEGYLFAPAEKSDTITKYWDDTAYVFTKDVNYFNNLTALFAKADADGVAVPKILLPAGEIEGNYTLSHSCEVLGYKHGINPIVRNEKPTEPDTLSAERGNEETVLTGKWSAKYTANNMTYVFDGITISGDGRFADEGNDKTGESITYKNIICDAGIFSPELKSNIRFSNNAYSEKTLTYRNIWMDGIKYQSGGNDNQLFFLNGSDTLIDNLYMANCQPAICSNVFFQSGKNYTRGLSLTIQNSKFYNNLSSVGAWLTTFYGDQNHAYNRYADREYVKTVIKDNMFYNCAQNEQSNPASNALFNLRYSYPCFAYEITGNTFIETREVYHFLTDDKHLGTDVFSQFFHLYPLNQGVGGVVNNIDLKNKVKVNGNRFIGRNTVINAELTYASTYPDLEDNFYIGYDAVQAMDSIDEIYTARGEDPYKAINMEAGDVENYYLDYALTTSATALTPVGEASVKDHMITLTQNSGVLTPAAFAREGQTAALYSDSACTKAVESIDTSALSKGTHVYYVKIGKNGISEIYTLALHTATTETSYKDAVMYDPAVADLAAGTLYFRQMNGTLYAFTVGESVFADIDDIVVHTQTAVPTVLLPEGNYTAEELSVVESVNFVTDKKAVYETPSVKKEKIKVLCVGDSVTLGTGVSNRTKDSYPAQLQNLLGEDYEVLNYGRGGALGSDSAGYGYESTWNYTLSLREAPDVIIMAFGANDAQTGYRHAPLEYFERETLEMIERYQALPSKPIVYIASTTHIISGWNTEWLTELRAMQKSISETAEIGFIDGNALSLGWGDPAEHYNDSCHPNAKGYVKMAADYKAAVDWTAQGAHQPETAEVKITFTAAPDGAATVNGKTYGTLEEALENAAKGDTVELNKDVTAEHITVNPEVTVDLNGNTLEVGYMIGFNTSAIVDKSEFGDGRLKVAKDKVALDKKNGGYLPVYDGEGYRFITVETVEMKAVNDETGETYYYFSPTLSAAHAELLKGATHSGVEIVVRLSWSKPDNYFAIQDFTYMDDMVETVIDSYDEARERYGKVFMATFEGSEAGEAQDLMISAVIKSETGAELATGGISFAE